MYKKTENSGCKYGGLYMKKRILLLCILISAVLISLTGCMPGDGTYTSVRPAGFFWGIWHGWIAPISLIYGFFNKNIRIYEVKNSGLLYDFGFYIAIISGFGGLNLFRKNRGNKNK